MCGISGFNFDDKTLIKAMCNLIIHRGPDDEGYFNDDLVSIGNRRLSVIDLETGHQPQHNENEDVWIVFNGEIYNFLDMKDELEKKGHSFYTNSDTETIIHAYEQWGPECVNKLRGQFAFCIYDSIKKILFIARDHMGLKPLYYYFDGSKFIFGSEIKCFFPHKIDRVINKRAINLYLSLKYVPFEETLFKGIYRVPPASYLIFDLKRKKLAKKKYWNIEFNSNKNKPLEQLVLELKKIIEDSIKIRLISDVPLGAFLSGGIDSSGIVGIMSKLTEKPVKTFSIGFEEGAPINETIYAKQVAQYFNTDHTEILVEASSFEVIPKLIWHLDDLISDPAIIPVFLMAKYSKDHITVALTGDGADEIFAGYSHFYKTYKRSPFSYFPNSLLKFILNYSQFIPLNKLKILLNYEILKNNEMGGFFKSILNILDIEKNKLLLFKDKDVISQIESKFINNVDRITQFINWDLNYQLPCQYNMKVDKMTMAASLEARVPYLDKNLVSWANSIPSSLKLKGNIEKYLLRLAFKDFLPPKIVKRKKQGFNTPIGFWLNTGLNEISAEILERLAKRKEFFNPKYIRLMKRNRHHELYMHKVWSLIMLEIWYETFLINDGLKPISF